jgi:UDP-N-acetylglucosamine--N-acetylmuramyl-(pentapeptide) pyrophosphoryl-undecaprenol N-acetylglucosamine transferase
MTQAEFTPDALAAVLAGHLDDPSGLTRAAAAAKSAGILDAAERLAALVMSLAKIDVPAAAAERTSP